MFCLSIIDLLMAGPWKSPRTPSPSHQVKLLRFLLLVFIRKFLTGLSISFRSSPPRFPQLLLAWDQVWESPTNSKQTFLNINSHIVERLLPGQASDFSSRYRNPNEIHKKTAARSNTSMVIIIFSATGAVAGTATEQDQFYLSHGNYIAFSRKNSAYVPNTLGKWLQALKQDAKWEGVAWHQPRSHRLIFSQLLTEDKRGFISSLAVSMKNILNIITILCITMVISYRQ